ncbi:ABC transporter substrate-binding protein [Limobrevibacterium gyesilva]|uniref:ABC transporter substrate-binding protein n=1 Tax=Limobrevibacterium gyesilva TaxID=2991712 RepID=A0AA41YHV2_9PROT|nr:ABC transporter substrate-binding protein [Limobrevibacterium gyesilva]MCW3473714.1 ABC transporter substrate-binding protein [Limobrevibacterium gyesilva]
MTAAPRLTLAAALGLALALTVSLGTAQAASPSFVKSGSVTLCTDPTYAPMEFFEHAGDKEPVGFDIDLARALAKRWGAQLRIITMDFTGLLPGVQAQRCDFVVSGTFLTPERLKNFAGVPYLVSSMVLMAPAGAKGISKPEDLSGKTLSVQAGTQYEKRAHALSDELAAKGMAPITIQSYPGGADAIQQLTTGRAAAAITQDTEAAYRAVAQPGQFEVAYVYPATDQFGVYFAKSDADVKLVQADIAALRADGTVKQLAAKWHMPESDATAPVTNP